MCVLCRLFLFSFQSVVYITTNTKNYDFKFDYVIDESNQNDVYRLLVEPLVEQVIEGFNCTLLTTGQSGSGKTYTMGFECGVCSIALIQIVIKNTNYFWIIVQVNPENNGVTPRVLNSLFSHQNAANIRMSVSFIEIYNSQAFDLLCANPQKPFFTKSMISSICWFFPPNMN